MRKGGRVFILLGVTLALAAAVLAIFAFRDTGDSDEDAEPEVVMVEVIEAAQDIPANHVMTESDIELVEVEQETVSPGTAQSTGQVLGLATSGDIVSGQRVLMANLVTPGLSHVVNEGMRAVAVPIDRVNALGGMIRADDRIDVVYSIAFEIEDFYAALREIAGDDAFIPEPPPEGEGEGEEGEAEQPEAPAIPGLTDLPLPFEPGSLVTIATSDGHEPVTKILLQNIRVVRVVAGDITVDDDGEIVAIDDSTEDDEEGEGESPAQEGVGTEPDRLPNADMLVLEVDPAGAELIKFMLDYEGQFQVALRGTEDTETVETPGMTFRQMIEDLGLPMPRPAVVPDVEDAEEQ